ncbi:MAG: imelysin family protein [Pseudobacteriovorax sp.]|nr:imelysin family protein [Pseudobacteriovorax sp.]
MRIGNFNQRLITTSLAAGLLLAACGGGGSDGDDISNQGETDSDTLPEFDRLALVTNLADNAQNRIQAFQVGVADLESKIAALCSSDTALLEDSELLTAARDAWKITIKDWQFLESFQWGPALADAEALRSDIYSWPLVNYCRVDREVATSVLDGAGYSLSEIDLTKGLPAIEYLLFDDDLAHSCTASVAETAGWNETSAAERSAARCAYLETLGADLSSKASSLAEAWQNGFYASYVSLAETPVLQSRINEIYQGIFYLEDTVKDIKLGRPLGLHSSCSQASCIDTLEHGPSGQSMAAIYQNLKGFEAAYTGFGQDGDAGFDGFLKETGHGALADRLATSLNESLSLAEPLQGERMEDLIQDQPCNEESALSYPLCQVFFSVKKVTDDLKGEFASVLNLEVPKQSAGDND